MHIYIDKFVLTLYINASSMYYHLKHLSLIFASFALSISPSFLPFSYCLEPLKAETKITQSSSTSIGKLQEFISIDGGFSILMPGKPTEEIEPANPQKGYGEFRQFFLEGEGGKFAYVIMYVDIPNFSQLLKSSEINNLFNKMRNETIGQGQLIQERTITLNNYPGREIEIESSDGFLTKARFFWVHPRMYMLMVMTSTKDGFPTEGNQVLDSFKLLANNPPQRQFLDPQQKPINPIRKKEAIQLYEKANQQYHQGQYQQALMTLQQGLAIVREIDDQEGEGIILTFLGITYEALKEYSKALEIYQQGLAIARQRNDRHNEAAILDYIGLVYNAQGHQEKAIESHQKALTIFRKIGNRISEAIVLINIGKIYQSQQQYDKALGIYQQTLIILRETKESQPEGVILDYIGVIYNVQGNYEKALDFHQQALTIFKKIGNRRSQAIVLGNIAKVYINLRQNQKAIEFLNQSLEIFKEIGDQESIRSILMQIQRLQQKS
jgi:tetratricopeptide (TPR) repeat protein